MRHWGSIKAITAAALGIIMISCGVRRHMPEGKLLLSKVTIVSSPEIDKQQRISPDELERYIQQSPNRRFFGTNFYIWAYNATNSEKDNWWNKLKAKIGQEPTYLSEELTQKSLENLKVYMNAQGYYASSAEYKVDTTARRRAKITYSTHQGRPYIINKFSYELRDSLIAPIILPDTVNSLVKVGDIFSVASLDKERERIVERMRESGYYNFLVNNIEYLADTLSHDYTVDLKLIIKLEQDGYDQRGNPILVNNKRFKVEQVNILPDYDPTIITGESNTLDNLDTTYYRGINIIHNEGVRPNVREKVLRQAVGFNADELYNSKQVEQTYKNIISIGYYKSARVSFEQLNSPISMPESEQDRRQRDTTTVTASPIAYLKSNIYCTPALRQSFNIELEGSTTSTFYGLTTTVGYQNRNVFRGAEAWDIDLTLGYEHMKAPDAVKKRATEVGVSTALTFPRFMVPFLDAHTPNILQPRTKAEIAISFQNRPYYERTISSASYTYTWKNRRYSNFLLRPIDINIIKMDYIDDNFYNDLDNLYLRNSYEPQVVAGITLGYNYNNSSKKGTTSTTNLRLNAETAGNSINAIESIFESENSAGRYEIFGTHYAQYARADIDLSHNIPLGLRSALVGRIYGGAGYAYGSSTSIPYDRLFYAGGSNSMRGWVPRTLGPGAVAEPESVVYPSQVGDMRLEANLEYRFPIWQNIHGATFLDAGNVWYINEDPALYSSEAVFHLDDFYKQLGLNTGIGVRFDIQFAILRLDWGIQLHNPNRPISERWIDNFNWSETSLNFGVGYPF